MVWELDRQTRRTAIPRRKADVLVLRFFGGGRIGIRCFAFRFIPLAIAPSSQGDGTQSAGQHMPNELLASLISPLKPAIWAATVLLRSRCSRVDSLCKFSLIRRSTCQT